MDFDKVIEKRQSVRNFRNKIVDWRKVIDAVETACAGPFAGNINNQKFMIVEDQDTINKIAKFCEQEWVTQVNTVVVLCSNESLLEKTYGERGRVYSRQQAGASIITLQLKLTDLGVDSCWVGAFDDHMLRQLLKVPGDVMIEAVIPIGYGELKPMMKNTKERKKLLGTNLTWDKWGQKKRQPYATEAPRHRDPWN